MIGGDMNWFVDFFADNKVVVAIANFGGAAAILYLVYRYALRAMRFILIARKESVRAARRRQRYLAAALAYRCAHDASTFIAVLMRIFLRYTLFAFMIFSLFIGSIDIVTGVITLQTKIEIIFTALMASYLVFDLFRTLASLSSAVFSINERRRLGRIGVPFSRRRVRIAPLF